MYEREDAEMPLSFLVWVAGTFSKMGKQEEEEKEQVWDQK